MSASRKRAMVAEFYDSHHETLFPQVYLLEAAGYEVHVGVQRRFVPMVRKQLPGRTVIGLASKGFALQVGVPFRVFFYLIRRGISTLAINSPESVLLRHLSTLLWLLPRVNVGCLAHSANLPGRKGSQRWIERRIRSWWLLSPHQRHHLHKEASRLHIGILHAWLWEDPAQPQKLPTVQEASRFLSPGPEAQLVLAIPGHPSRKRRDYQGLFAALEQGQPDPRHIQFWLLGDYARHDGPGLLEEIKQRSLGAYFRYGTERISPAPYAALLQACHGMLPLLHQHLPEVEKYQTVKTSGNVNLALGHNLPIALPEGFQVPRLAKPYVVSYPEVQLADCLNTWKPESFDQSPRQRPLSLEEMVKDYLAVWE